jgi:hypothetical protein
MLHKLLIFLGKNLANVGSRDVELLGLLVGVYCALGVVCAPADLTRVDCAGICVTILGAEGTTH